jgi:hypothetical protein
MTSLADYLQAIQGTAVFKTHVTDQKITLKTTPKTIFPLTGDYQPDPKLPPIHVSMVEDYANKTVLAQVAIPLEAVLSVSAIREYFRVCISTAAKAVIASSTELETLPLQLKDPGFQSELLQEIHRQILSTFGEDTSNQLLARWRQQLL